MDSSNQFIKIVNEVLSVDCCMICGKNHNLENCDYIKITNHVPDTPIPSRAKLTLPSFLEIQILSDGSPSILTKSLITKGTQFGPFQAEKLQNLNPSILFPLKIFTADENQNCLYLDNNNENKCNWLMYISAAETAEEQNLTCYQNRGEIFYVAIKDVNVGETLKVWYSPYYAFKMKKTVLPTKNPDDPLKNVDVNSLIKKQQKIMERKLWTCKFCSQTETTIVAFARHILKHYTAQHKNMCEVCKKTFGSKKHLKNHMKIVHKTFLNVFSVKPSTKEVGSKVLDKDAPLGGPLLNDMFTDSSDLNQFDLSLDNQNILLDNDNLTVENFLNENVKDLDHFNFEIDDNQKQFVCDICLKQFTKAKLLIIHLKHHTGDYMCHKCLKIFCRRENLKSHICNTTVRHRCILCDKTFIQKKYLSRHIQAVHNQKYHCVSCKKSYHSNKELLEHNCNKIPETEKEKFICPICDKVFFRDLYLKKHLKTHEPKIKQNKINIDATCEICGLHLENRNSYYFHKKKHEQPSYQCEICKKKFHRLDVLKEHVLIHEEIAKFECEICQKKFKSKKVLNNHKKKHNGSGEMLECEICKKMFGRRPNLNKHMKNFHSKSRLQLEEFYKCPICNKAIKLKSSVLRHLRKVHGDVGNVDLSSITSKVKNNEEKTKSKEVCLSIPDLSENYQEITLDKNAYILDNGTIVQPQGDSDNVIIYVLDQTF